MSDRPSRFAIMRANRRRVILKLDEGMPAGPDVLLPVEHLDLNARALNCLKASGLNTVAGIFEHVASRGPLTYLMNVGFGTDKHIKAKLFAAGFPPLIVGYDGMVAWRDLKREGRWP